MVVYRGFHIQGEDDREDKCLDRVHDDEGFGLEFVPGEENDLSDGEDEAEDEHCDPDRYHTALY